MKRYVFSLIVALALTATGCSSLGNGDGNSSAAPGDRPVTTGTINAQPDPGADPVDPSTPTDEEPTGVDPDALADPDLVWTVVAVERDDVLNVRIDPDASATIVDTLEPWTTGVTVLAATEETANGTWRLVRTTGGAEGWVNSRFLTAQPAELTPSERDQLLDRSEEFVRFATEGGSDEDASELLADRALWVGGLGIFGDGVAGWNWFPADDVDRPDDWDRVRTFELGPDFGEFACGADCEKSINDFMKFDRIDDSTQYLVNDIPDVDQGRGFLDGALWQAPESLHRVVIDTPTSDPQSTLDWQRIHLVFDWSGGGPEVLLINTHGWTP